MFRIKVQFVRLCFIKIHIWHAGDCTIYIAFANCDCFRLLVFKVIFTYWYMGSSISSTSKKGCNCCILRPKIATSRVCNFSRFCNFEESKIWDYTMSFAMLSKRYQRLGLQKDCWIYNKGHITRITVWYPWDNLILSK